MCRISKKSDSAGSRQKGSSFTDLLAKGAFAASSGTTKSASAASAASNDVFHAGVKFRLFEIVIRKITDSRGQINAFPWCSVMNRLMRGLDKKEPLKCLK